MTIRRVSVILPCRGFDDFPTHFTGAGAAELLAAITGLWHPQLLEATKSLPNWLPADDLPDPATLEGELVVVPSVSRERMPPEWCNRFETTAPLNYLPVTAAASRRHTLDAVLAAAGIRSSVAATSVAAFLALGHAHLQVELLTRALRYTSVLDTEQFTSAVVAAASAAVTGDHDVEREELGRAFDLLSDARNHVYSVDFYVIDVTLLADSTLGEPLRAKLAGGAPTNLLITGSQLALMARDHAATLGELKRGIESGTACLIGGLFSSEPAGAHSPESLLEDFVAGRQAATNHLGHEFEIFGQFSSDFSPLLPSMLKSLGFRGALHTAFDGGRLPKADQRKTNWGAGEGGSIEALATLPLDLSLPETWLKFAERIGDTIAHDHVATILFAGWPGAASEYFDDVRAASRFNSVLGKLVTLDEYFRESREADSWTNFYPREYPDSAAAIGANAISKRVAAYRRNVRATQHKAAAGLAATVGFPAVESNPSADRAVINPWNAMSAQVVNGRVLAPIDEGSAIALEPRPDQKDIEPQMLPEVPGCGFAMLGSSPALPPLVLAEKLTLRNDRLELTVSKKTGGIQSIRRHRDRNTRVSQRLVFHHHTGGEPVESRMVGERIDVTRNDALVGEITSRGRILGPANDMLAGFTQRVRSVRGVPAIYVEIDLEPQHMPAGDIWKSYFASRMAWSEESLAIRRGKQWAARDTSREQIDSSEWVEIDDGIGRVTCFALGLPFHRVASPQWLDTLLVVAGEQRRRFQLAIGIDQPNPAHAALALLSACDPYLCAVPTPPSVSRGWFVHIGAKNVLGTHIEPLGSPAAGIRLRLLETEGKETRTTATAFRPFRSAWRTDFRGHRTDVLSVSEGNAEFDLPAYGFLQIEAEW